MPKRKDCAALDPCANIGETTEYVIGASSVPSLMLLNNFGLFTVLLEDHAVDSGNADSHVVADAMQVRAAISLRVRTARER